MVDDLKRVLVSGEARFLRGPRLVQYPIDVQHQLCKLVLPRCRRPILLHANFSEQIQVSNEEGTSTNTLGKATIARTLCVIDATWQCSVMWACPDSPSWAISLHCQPYHPNSPGVLTGRWRVVCKEFLRADDKGLAVQASKGRRTHREP